MMPKTETSGDDAVEEQSTSINWEEDPVIKAERPYRFIFLYSTQRNIKLNALRHR